MKPSKGIPFNDLKWIEWEIQVNKMARLVKNSIGKCQTVYVICTKVSCIGLVTDEYHLSVWVLEDSWPKTLTSSNPFCRCTCHWQGSRHEGNCRSLSCMISNPTDMVCKNLDWKQIRWQLEFVGLAEKARNISEGQVRTLWLYFSCTEFFNLVQYLKMPQLTVRLWSTQKRDLSNSKFESPLL